MNRHPRTKLLTAVSIALLCGHAAAQPPLFAGSTEGDASISELQALFEKLDANGDGMLNRAEASAEERLSDEVWRRIDLTNDNELTRAEFLSARELRDIDTYGSGGPTAENLRGPESGLGAGEERPAQK